MALNLKSTITRAISGAVYVAIICGAILYGRIGVIALCVVLAAAAAAEFLSIMKPSEDEPLWLRAIDIAACASLAAAPLQFPVLIWACLVLLRLMIAVFRTPGEAPSGIATSLMVQIYIGAGLAFAAADGLTFGSTHLLLALFLFIWLNDTGAFLVGSLFGRHKLFERVSPKKTWEGFAGGIILCIIAAILFAVYCPAFFGLPGNIMLWVLLSIIVSLASTVGDFFESHLKRCLNLKDSGHISPGHGGILDRIDSLLFAMPAAFIFLAICASLGIIP